MKKSFKNRDIIGFLEVQKRSLKHNFLAKVENSTYPRNYLLYREI